VEGYEYFDNQIVLSGDIMYDAALYYKSKADKESKIIDALALVPGKYILATIHRQENTDDLTRLKNIITALNELNKNKKVVVPLHPRTKKLLDEHKLDVTFTVIDPVGYLDMIALVSQSYIILTDSGGLQKEAFFFGKYCLTMRDQTEWVELVGGGFNTLVGADAKTILDTFHELQLESINFDTPLYGDGKTAKKIVDALVQVA
jgi:UDP-GlcNAc3NAcA epimerase